MFKVKGFIPYILIVFFNAFVDLGHKILIQNTLYQTETASHFSIYSSIVNALILIPYLLLFTPSGFLSDKFPKRTVLRVTAIVAIPLTILATWCYFHGLFKAAFCITLFLAIQSVFNSPAKYGYIKEIFGKANIARANAFVQSTAIISILAGTFVFSVIFDHYVFLNHLQHSADKSAVLMAFAPAGLILITISVLETIFTFILPKKSAADPAGEYQIKNYFRGYYLKSYLKEIRSSRVIFLCILGLGIFWGINQVLIAGYGAYLKAYAGDPTPVFVQGAFGLGGIGILLGAGYAGRVSRGFIEIGMVPIAALGISIGLILLPILVSHWGILACFFVYGFFGGMLLVPLNALIQFNANDKKLGKILAANNFVQNAFMLSFLLMNILYISFGGNIRIFLFGLCALAIVATVYSLIALPQSMLRYLLYFLVTKFYRIQVYGLDNIPSTGGILFLGNHTSFLDWALIQIASPRPIRFVIERSIYQRWYLRWVLQGLKMIPISKGGNRQSMEAIAVGLKNGEVIALFPEGRLSRNGQVGHFSSGFETAVAGTGVQIIPFYLRGLWGSASSYATPRYKQISKIRQRRIGIIFGSPISDKANAAVVKQRVIELSIKAWKLYIQELGTIPEEWLSRVKQFPGECTLIDSTGVELTNAELLSTVMYMQKQLRPLVQGQKNVGLLLPASAGGVIANLSLLTLGKTVVNLNYTIGVTALKSCLEQAEITTVISSELFMKKLAQKGYVLQEAFNACDLLYLEDYKRKLTKVLIVKNYLLARLLPSWLLRLLVLKRGHNTDTAAILFSSGSEGEPKGVRLSHRNLLCNAKQISSVFNIEENEAVLCALPLFHAFGLTATTVMPLVDGMTMICHPDPTDVLTIAKLIYTYKVTFLCGTSTLFNLYCRNKRVLPQMMQSLRLVVAGAEKLNDRVRAEFKLRFNLDIYEGYGATEVSPVASSNLPDILDPREWHVELYNRIGTVGLPLPGTAFKIVDPETLVDLGLNAEGMVLIGGTQVMQGYLNNPEKSQRVLIPDGDITWYVTGDKGRLDEDGYLTIIDRYSRFAKIAGEMISLTAVEQTITAVLPEEGIEIMAVAVPDARKGEKIVVLYAVELDLAGLRQRLTESGMSNLSLPAEYLKVEQLPKLGSGKKDYQAGKTLAITMIEKVA